MASDVTRETILLPDKWLSKEDLKLLIQTEFPNNQRMLSVAVCESGIRHFAPITGTILTSKTNDLGLFQINSKTWLEKSKELGYDIYTVRGNIKMARYIYEVQGINAWVCNKLI